MDQVARSVFCHFYAPFDRLRLVEAAFSSFDLPWLFFDVCGRDWAFRVFSTNFAGSNRFCDANG